jgi:RNA polymerase sigma factor (TIGR02999 family)
MNETSRIPLNVNEEFSAGDLTALISSWRGGRSEALGDLVSAAYPKLRGIAEAFLRKESHAHTLQATGLVNELYLLLRQQRTVSMVSRSDFFSFAAYLIRLILLNRARQRLTQTRGGGGARVPLTEELSWIDAAGEDMIGFAGRIPSHLGARPAFHPGLVV